MIVAPEKEWAPGQGLGVGFTLREWCERIGRRGYEVDPKTIPSDADKKVFTWYVDIGGMDYGNQANNCGMGTITGFNSRVTPKTNRYVFPEFIKGLELAKATWGVNGKATFANSFTPETPNIWTTLSHTEKLQFEAQIMKLRYRGAARAFYMLSDNVNIDIDDFYIKPSEVIEALKCTKTGTVYDFPFSSINPNHSGHTGYTVIKTWLWVPPDREYLIVPELKEDFETALDAFLKKGYSRAGFERARKYFERCRTAIPSLEASSDFLSEQIKKAGLAEPVAPPKPPVQPTSQLSSTQVGTTTISGYNYAYNPLGGLIFPFNP